MSLQNGYAPVYTPAAQVLPSDLVCGELTDDRPLAERGVISSLGDLLNVLIGSLEDWGIEPEPRSVSANGFTIRLQNHLVRVGFGATMS